MTRALRCWGIAAAPLLFADVLGQVQFDDAWEDHDEDELKTCLLQSRLTVSARPHTELVAAQVDVSAGVNASPLEEAAWLLNGSSELIASQEGRSGGARPAPAYGKLLLFLGILGLYGVAALVYELKSGPEEEQPKDRLLEWDGLKLFAQVAIVGIHLQYFVMIDSNAFTDGWQKQLTTVLDNPLRAWQSYEHFNNFSEWVVFGMPAISGMSSLAFASGVFAQKVSKAALLSLFCYTYGTYYMMMLLTEITHLMSGGALRAPFIFEENAYWYLIDLFWWRLTLSSLFAAVNDWTIKARLMVLVVLSVLFYSWYDCFGYVEPWLYSLRSRFGLAIPTHRYLSLGPFFALGLAVPLAKWSELLRNRHLRMLAYFIGFGCFYGGLLVPQYRVWLQGHKWLELDWPTYPDVSKAFEVSRLGEHVFYFSYKGVATFAMIWVVGHWTSVLGAVAPAAAPALLAGGSRSLVSYVLHFRLIDIATDLCDAHEVVGRLGTVQWCILAWTSAVCIVWILTSRLTAKVLGPLIVPFWLLKVFELFGLSAAPPRKDRSADGYAGGSKQTPHAADKGEHSLSHGVQTHSRSAGGA
eukprot:TRINITY_DN26877_c0_g1_i1.p1 TRINITY_DN26877_c0_g1~~TRINITY_DN26877_c0_g1_i1.p1  ORF type:complete len:582 (+),score=66.54 TRINITY_DN26877_c0_g1_i1:54-1799(+)